MSDAFRQTIDAALRRVAERAAREAPEHGSFEPIVERVVAAHPVDAIGSITLRIGPGQGSMVDSRFLDVRVATPSEGSDSSEWVLFLPKAELLRAIADESTGIARVLSAIETGIESLARHRLP